MKKKLLFVAAMMLAAFGASAQGLPTIEASSVTPDGGTYEAPAKQLSISTITVAFPDSLYFADGELTDTLEVYMGSTRFVPGVETVSYRGIASIRHTKNGCSVTTRPLDAEGNVITLTEPDTLSFFLQSGTLGTKEWVSDKTKGKINANVTKFYFIPKVLNYVEVSPAAAVLVDPMNGIYEGGVVDTLKQVTITFAEKTYLAEGKTSVDVAQGIMDYSTYSFYSSRIDLAADGLSATITPVGVNGEDTTIATPGTINVIVLANTFGDEAFSKGEADCATNTEWGLTYLIPYYHVESVDPADGSELISLTGVTITFEEEIAGIVSDSAAFINLDRTADPIRGDIVLNADKKSITITPKSREINEPGTYRLVIPTYSFGDADFVEAMSGEYPYPMGAYNYELTYTYVIGEGLTGDITIDPADGSTVGGIHAITIDFGQPVEIAQFFDAEGNVVAAPVIEVKDAEGNVVATADNRNDDILHPEDDENGTKMTITFPDTVRAAGTYTIAIPEMFQYMESADNEKAPAMNLTYTVDPALPMSVSPVSGSVLTAITNVYVVYANDYTIAEGQNIVTFHNPAATENGDYQAYLTKQGDTIVIMPQSRDIATAGTYTVVIPEGALQMTSDPSKVNKELSLTYTVGEEQGGFTITPSNNSTVKELKVFTIDLGAAGGPSYNTQEKITITNAAGEVVAEVDGESVEPVDPEAWEEDEWVITFPTAVTAAGEYVLTIPMDFFNVGDEMNPVLHYHYTVDAGVSAITEVEAAAEGVTVYNLQGVLVLQSDDAADLKTLENGLYIVNGKAMIIVK